MKVVVGIDVSKDWFDVAWKDNDRIKNQRFDSTISGINQLMKATPAEAIYVMDDGGTVQTSGLLGRYTQGKRMKRLMLQGF